MKGYSQKILSSVAVVSLLSIAGFSQDRQQKNAPAANELTGGAVNLNASSIVRPGRKRDIEPLPSKGRESLLSRTTLPPSPSILDSGPGGIGFTGEFSVASGGINSHNIGLVQEGRTYRVQAIGLQGFNPVIVSMEAHLVETTEPNGVLVSGQNCEEDFQKACLDLQASGSGPIVIFLRDANYKEGRYRLFVSVF